MITDFGSAKIVDGEENNKEESEETKRRKNSFVGTAQYVSPEILTNTESTYASDLWAYGCIIFQMICGMPPFRGSNEYLIFQKILKLNYEFSEGFNRIAKDLIEKLLVLNPNERLGATDASPYTSIRSHPFFDGVDWNNLGPPPTKLSFLTGTSEQSTSIPQNLEPGLDEQKVSRLHLESDILGLSSPPTRKKSEPNRKITDLSPSEIEQRLDKQKLDKWHNLVEGNLILKQGLVDKRKGLFARRRMFLLTLGPHLYYVDPASMVLKGEIPWSASIKAEAKNFKTFFVHTVRI